MLTKQQRFALTQRLYGLARTNFVAFLAAMYPQGVGRPYILTRFHLALADHVQHMADGTIGPHQSISAPPQHGKALANNTLIPTPSGLVRIDSLVPGSEVFAADGTVTQVLAVKEWKNRPVYKLTISDGTEILADENHDWSVCLPDKSSRFQVLSTKALAERKSLCFPLLPVAAGVLRPRFIERIEPAGYADVTCIQVAHPSSLFLCTAAHIPTHNSNLLAIRAVAWLIGRYPGVSIALTGFSRSLLVGFLAGAKESIESKTYARVFPNIRPVFGQDRIDYIRFTNGSTVIVKSAGSKLTGRGADWLIVDDAHAGRAEAESDILRQKVITWFKSDCLTRISPTAKILVIGTRFHKEDLIGTISSESFARALEDAGQGHRRFQHTNFQAIYDGRNPDPVGRSDGEPLAPETRPMDFLQGQRALLFGYEWDAQYQGDPGAYTVGQVDVSKLQYCSAADVPKDIRRTRGWDTALSEKQTADFTAGARCSADDGYFYIEDMAHFRAAWPIARKRISELALKEKETHGIHRIGVEGVAGFGVVVQSLRELLLGEVSVTQRNPPKGGKLLRAQPWLTKIEAGKVVIVRGAWNAAFVRELEQFPDDCAHDDQCFAAGTLIATENGERPIESIQPGEKVWTRKGLRPVTRLWKNGKAITHTYALANGRRVTATANHPVITSTGTAIPIDSVTERLRHGMLVYVSHAGLGSSLTVPPLWYAALPVGRLTQTESVREVFNLEVEGEHEYFAEGLLVHNCDAVSVAFEELFHAPRLLLA